jgi:ATP-dependent DNA ligase
MPRASEAGRSDENDPLPTFAAQAFRSANRTATSSGAQQPSGEIWLHEIKHDGFRVIARKNGERVKLYSHSGNDLMKRFPLIIERDRAAGPTLLHHRRRGRRLRG